MNRAKTNIPSHNEKMSSDKDGITDYAAVIKKYPWLIQKDQNCISSILRYIPLSPLL